MLLILSTNNTQERLVTPLVDRLEGEITRRARDLLLTPYLERDVEEDSDATSEEDSEEEDSEEGSAEDSEEDFEE